MTKDIIFFDSTLRDGSHAIGHKLTVDNIRNYCTGIDGSGLHVVIVGHGNGLGASSLQIGLSALPDQEMLTTARKALKKTKLGAFLIPGLGTIKDNLAPAIDLGVDLVCVACHCTEADVTGQHIDYVRKRGKDVYGVLMMCHMAAKEKLLMEAKKMQSYGALGVILMDSAGAFDPNMLEETVSFLSKKLDIPVGFHGHNNLGLAVSNSLTAIRSGAKIIDGTIRGFGAGAGNCQLEVFIGLLSRMKIETGVDLYKLMDVSDGVVAKIMHKAQEIDSVSLTSGMAGVFSGFAPYVKKAAERFSVDPRDIFIALGKRKIVGGQEDFIIDVALEIANKKAKDQNLSF
ncbi:MAG: 4-hydroxy-2-oxovalerate aldolase [Candidatus Omnitrophica bacterium]|nr:4-hydroxy-2-oxovalerate aldolase [Candidatus Omnitrophota bacterium]